MTKIFSMFTFTIDTNSWVIEFRSIDDKDEKERGKFVTFTDVEERTIVLFSLLLDNRDANGTFSIVGRAISARASMTRGSRRKIFNIRRYCKSVGYRCVTAFESIKNP